MQRSILALPGRWLGWPATVVAAVLIVGGLAFLILRGDALQANGALNCSSEFRLSTTLPTGARWEMCWEHRQAEGILFYDVHYTPVGGVRRKVLAQANVAQIHVPYDDNGARFHDLSDYGLGDANMNALTPADCPGGALLAHAGKNVLCAQVESRGYAYKYYSQQLQGYQLSLFSVSHIGQYNYIQVWRFADNGAIEPSIGATGALQRLEYDAANHGWHVRSDETGDLYAISHMHNYYWRLDFDIDGPAYDLVEEFEFTPDSNNEQYSITVNPLFTEAARTVNPLRMRSWRVRDTAVTNRDGHPISYHLEPLRVGHIHQGPASEPFTHHQFYVTRNQVCEKWVSHNPAIGCVNNVSGFVNGENLVGEDVVLWYGISFHHLPRDEDEAMMDAHWDGFQIVPRDWTESNPLDNVTIGATPAATRTPTPLPATDMPTATPAPPTPTDTATPTATTVPTNTPAPSEATATVTITVTPATIPASPTVTATPAAMATLPATTMPPTATATSTPASTPAPPLVTATVTATPGGVAGATVCFTYHSTDIPQLLADMPAMVSSTLAVTENLVITDVNASIYMAHSYVGDLSFVLQHQPSSRAAAVVDRPGAPASAWGCMRDDINVILDDEAELAVESRCEPTQPAISGVVAPAASLGAFDGINAAGNWVLTVTDHNTQADTGKLSSWGLQICGANLNVGGMPTPPVVELGYNVPVIPVGEDNSPPRSDLTNTIFLPQINR